MQAVLEEMPRRIRQLRKCPKRGIPVPWFVAWIDGVPEFRVAEGYKREKAIKERRCWVCGQTLTDTMTFVLGGMCGINRTTTEPPCHLECARYSAQFCPFLSKPQMVRRENGLPEDAHNPAGEAILRNPGATLLWTTKGFEMFSDGKGGQLIRIGSPIATEWWAEGKAATRAQVERSVDTGLPILLAMCSSPAETNELLRRHRDMMKIYPAI
jgi:hypothetical protein